MATSRLKAARGRHPGTGPDDLGRSVRVGAELRLSDTGAGFEVAPVSVGSNRTNDAGAVHIPLLPSGRRGPADLLKAQVTGNRVAPPIEVVGR